MQQECSLIVECGEAQNVEEGTERGGRHTT